MFRSSTIIRELALNLAKVIFTLKYSVKLRRYLLSGCVVACCHTTACQAQRNEAPLPDRFGYVHCLLICSETYRFSGKRSLL